MRNVKACFIVPTNTPRMMTAFNHIDSSKQITANSARNKGSDECMDLSASRDPVLSACSLHSSGVFLRINRPVEQEDRR